jgi:signal transduction histidine kinase/CheY-like chemotaxis protein
MQAVVRRDGEFALPQRWETAAGLCAAYFVALWASLSLTTADHVPLFWLSNAFIAAMLVILSDRPVLKPALAIAFLGSIAIMAAAYPNPIFAVTRASLNMGEGVLCGWLALRILGPRRLLRTSMDFLRLQLMAVLPAALVQAVLREAAIRALGAHDATSWRMAIAPHLLGLAITLPALLLLFQPAPAGLRRSWRETLGVVLILAGVTHLVFNIGRFPTAFLISPMLLIAAIRLGPRGSVFGHLAVALVCLPATIAGGGSFALHPEWGPQERALIYQAVILSSAFGVSFCAFTVAEQARLRRLLMARAASARDARRRALSASRAKSEFLATMSHEIRTPMNSILGFTQLLLQNERVPKAARDQVAVIAEAGGSLMTVLNDILDFSKVEAGQVDLHLEPVAVAELMAGTVEIMGEAARTKGLTLRLEAEGVASAFLMDGQRLRQVLLNLLNNAVKFTDAGHVLLTAALKPDGRTLRFEVRDTGVGIDEDVVGRLFTRFSQADSSTTRDYGGTGLGLAICKGLVERMGGCIGVESRLRHGALFWFELPAEPAPASATPGGEEGTARQLKGRVLLVDDHPMNLRLGDTLLRVLGCEVDLAASGQEAIAAARAVAYDAILMDLHMPRMDGLAAARAIRALGGPNRQVPIIAMSADVMPESVDQCLAAGMAEHVAKPIQLKALHEALERQMAGQARRKVA